LAAAGAETTEEGESVNGRPEGKMERVGEEKEK
jgi:hypothetical protein